MAKFDLKFIDDLDETDFIKTKVRNIHNKYVIEISGMNDNCNQPFRILLDKSTAIKFAKTLRTEINKITESEVYNG